MVRAKCRLDISLRKSKTHKRYDKLRNVNDGAAQIGSAGLTGVMRQHRAAALLTLLHLFRLQLDMRAAHVALGAGMLLGW